MKTRLQLYHAKPCTSTKPLQARFVIGAADRLAIVMYEKARDVDPARKG